MAHAGNEAMRSRASRLPGSRRNLPWPIYVGARDLLVRYRHIGIRASDLLVDCYPKSGSTWLRFVLTNAVTGEEIDFDKLDSYSPVLGEQRGKQPILRGNGRLLMSHELPRVVVPARPQRVVYLIRDGRDVAVSYFHHLRRQGRLQEVDLMSFLPRFLSGRISPYGTWHHHVLSWTKLAQHDSKAVAVVRYEDLLSEPVPTLRRVSDHFGLGIDPQRLEAALAASSPEAMREKEGTSRRIKSTTADSTISFVRVARAGQWREEFSPEAIEQFDRIAGAGLRAGGYPNG